MIYPLESKKFIVEFDKSKVEELLKSKKYYKGEETFLHELYELKTSTTSFVTTSLSTYEYYLTKPNYEGRYLNAKFMSLSCKSRQYLLKDNYYDFDIVASQPNVMMSLFKKNKLDCPKLANYCLRRDKKLNSIIDCFKLTDSIIHKGLIDEKEYTAKAKAKELFNSMLNLGTFEGWANKFNINISDVETTYFDDFQAEMKQNITKLSMIEKTLYLQISKKCKLENKTNVLGCFASAMYKKYERLLLESLLESFPEIYGIYAFDGVMINKQSLEVEQIDEFLSAFKQITIDKFGEEFNNVIMITKEMNDPWDIKVDELPPLEIKEIKETTTALHVTTPSSKPQKITFNMLKEKTHANFADLYYINNPKDYIYSNGCWYMYNNVNRIKKLDSKHPPSLKNKISIYFKRLILDMIESIPPNDEKLADLLKLSSELIKFVGTDRELSGIISLAIHYYTDDELMFKIDTNTNLLVFKNRLFDLTINLFREIYRDDFVMKHCGYDISEIRNMTICNKIKDEILNIFDNPTLANFWLEHTALSCFTNKYEVFYCHTGKGGNGKGLLFNFLKNTLGDYYYQTGTEFLTTRIEDGKANPTLANAKGTRFLVCSEPETEKTKVRVDFVKAITGLDDINCRDLYNSNKFTYKPTYTTFLQCNDIPDFSKIDGGIRRRFKKIDYPNQFVDKPVLKNEKLKDDNLKELFNNPEYINEFMLILIETAMNTTKLIIPKEIEFSSKSFLDEQDKVYSWLEEFTIRSDTGRISKSEAYNLFLLNMNEKKTEFTAVKFHKQMNKNNIEEKKIKGNRYYSGINFIKVIEDCNINLEEEL